MKYLMVLVMLMSLSACATTRDFRNGLGTVMQGVGKGMQGFGKMGQGTSNYGTRCVSSIVGTQAYTNCR